MREQKSMKNVKMKEMMNDHDSVLKLKTSIATMWQKDSKFCWELIRTYYPDKKKNPTFSKGTLLNTNNKY